MKKEPSERQLRVGEEVRHILSDVLMKEEFFDEDIQGPMIMITEVQMSPDLGLASAYVRPIGKKSPALVVEALNRHKSFFRKFLGHRIRLRLTPDIGFFPDTTFDTAAKIDKLLNLPVVRQDILKEYDDEIAEE